MSYKVNNRVGYIRYNNRIYENYWGKILNIIRKIFIKVIVEKIENGVIILIPKYDFNKSNNFIKNKIIKQINNKLENNNIKYVVFEEKLQSLKNQIENIDVLNGKYLMKNVVFEILKHIYKIKKTNIKLENIYIFLNEYTPNNISIVKMLSTKCKTVNIITENLKYFSRLEESLYKEGILITVSNNKRKSAKNAEIIINFDFSKSSIEKYSINMNAIIINLTNEKIFFENTFRGVLINNFEICINSNLSCFCDEFYGEINKKLYLESFLINREQNYISNEYIKNEAKILGLIGVRGKIHNEEFMEECSL